MKITSLDIIDLRFPTSLTADGTDAVHKDPDYSAAYVILYTDGVTEAFNTWEECYGNERLLADIGALGGSSAGSVTKGLLQNVRAFAGKARQSDDIAILTLKVNANGGGVV